MNEQNDNFDEFLRKKIHELDASKDGWDRPDAKVWAQAQKEILPYPSMKKRRGLGWIISLALLLLLTFGGILFYLNRQVNRLKKTTLVQQEILAQTKDQLTNKYLNEQQLAQVEREQEAQEKKWEAEKYQLEQQVKKQQAQIQRLETLVQQQQNKLLSAVDATWSANVPAQALIAQSQEENLQQDIRALFKAPTQLKAFTPNDQANLHSVASPVFDTKQPGRRPKWEVGYTYGLQDLNFPTTGDFFGEKSKSYLIGDNIQHAGTYGSTLGFAPAKKLWLQIGFRRTKATVNRSWKVDGYYDKSTEYEKPDGSRGNDLSFGLRSPYSEVSGAIKIEVPEEADLESGNWFGALVDEQLELTYYQIPVGIAYVLGENRLQWRLQGGLQWNWMNFKGYELSSEIAIADGPLAIDKIELGTQPENNTQFLGMYAGLGIDYRIGPHWYANFGLAAQYGFLSTSTQDFSTADLITREIKLGLNYRF